MARQVKRAGSRKTLTADNLAAMGAERLAAILMESAEEEAGLKRRLRLELAAEVGPDHLATELAKRLTTVEGRRSRVHWRKYKAFVRDLDILRAMITGRLAVMDPKLGLEMLWRFLAMAGAVFEQVNDERGEAAAVFEVAVSEIGPIVAAGRPDSEVLAEQVAAALEGFDVLVLQTLVPNLLPSLDAASISALRTRVQAAFQAKARPSSALRAATQQLADAEGDVEGYVATINEADRRRAWAGAEIGRRLLAAGRIEDALAALAQSAPPSAGRVLLHGVQEWEQAFLAALEADGQAALAQDLRWEAFDKRLAIDRLRAFLKRLPDFDDIQAEERAMAHVLVYPSFIEALQFLMAWPAPATLAALMLSRAKEIPGARYDLLEPAVRLLEARFPLAASLALRATIGDILRERRFMLYGLADLMITELESLAAHVADWGEFDPHATFAAQTARIRRF